MTVPFCDRLSVCDDCGEVWLPVWGTDDYEVSNLGRVRSGRRVLTPSPNNYGYLKVCLGRKRQEYVHRLVAAAFRGPCPWGMTVDHIDFNRTNNVLENLRYLDAEENRRRQERYEIERWGVVVSNF